MAQCERCGLRMANGCCLHGPAAWIWLKNTLVREMRGERLAATLTLRGPKA